MLYIFIIKSSGLAGEWRCMRSALPSPHTFSRYSEYRKREVREIKVKKVEIENRDGDKKG